IYQLSSQFSNPRTAEYAVSGRPVAWDLAVEAHDTFDDKWTAFAKSHDDLEKKKSNNGLTSSMFLSGRRPVFCSNTATQDEGRASELDNTYKLLSFLSDTSDLRFNRVPEVLVYNTDKGSYRPISFHQLHRLGAGLVMPMTLPPIAFSWGGKQHAAKKPELGWEYRLVTITVVGRREDDALSSPTKMIVKRKALTLHLDDSDDDGVKRLVVANWPLFQRAATGRTQDRPRQVLPETPVAEVLAVERKDET
ncbi:hypothetical protein K438DRAFT_2140269, partial [Mycena galopus ATCC 62051]